MAGPTNCDGCAERQAIFMVTEIDTGNTNAWCPYCYITAAGSLAEMLTEAGLMAPAEAPKASGRGRKSKASGSSDPEASERSEPESEPVLESGSEPAGDEEESPAVIGS